MLYFGECYASVECYVMENPMGSWHGYMSDRCIYEGLVIVLYDIEPVDYIEQEQRVSLLYLAC